MRIVTFAPSLTAVEEEAGGLALRGFPMTSGFVDVFPAEITVNVVVAVCTLNGDEYDPVRYLVATSPTGERLSTMQFGWHWDDNPDCPIKFRVLAQQLPIVVGSKGSYTLALCEDAADDAEQVFPLQIPGGRAGVDRGPPHRPALDANWRTATQHPAFRAGRG